MKHIYYQIKPMLPRAVQSVLRRRAIMSQLPKVNGLWPTNEMAGWMPKGWPGWSKGKRFATVLTHDVQTKRGMERVRQLAELEMEMGFRSCFNFVPEGPYHVPAELRRWLVENGFEVGVYGLKHDGKLYRSRRIFRQRARRINSYLKEWASVGFRSPFMYHNFEWLYDLNIQYDMSTFDTDPFEQPDGVDTIFPFQLEGPDGKGYVEIPYTLAQDSTLFVYMNERSIRVWKDKIDWLAEQRALVHVIVHPDYIDFAGNGRSRDEYPIRLYVELLELLRTKFEGEYWQALPKEISAFVKSIERSPVVAPKRADYSSNRKPKQRVWIDLDNTPHVPFFEPVIWQLRRRGYEPVVTARKAFQVCELADQKGLMYKKVGRHFGRNRFLKILGLTWRALRLAPVVLRERPVLALSHGSRSQIMISKLLRVPTVVVADYEFADFPFIMRPGWVIAPEVVPTGSLCCRADRIRKYPGIKEDVYSARFSPNPKFLDGLDLTADEILVTVRPPATEAHYHNAESEALFVEFMDLAVRAKKVRGVLLPRNKRQEAWIRSNWPHWFCGGRTVVPESAVDGLNLLWYSDLVVSGGGTMNREAAALGVPVYSIFRGKIGAVDHYLQAEGRLILITSPADVHKKIVLTKRSRKSVPSAKDSIALARILEHIEAIVALVGPKPGTKAGRRSNVDAMETVQSRHHVVTRG